MTDWLFPALCGLLTGILSSWGVGGGTLLLLCMTLFFGVEQRTAQAINLLYFLPTAAAALLLHAKNRMVEWKAVLPAAAAGCATAALAAWLAAGLETELLRRLFGGFLILVGLSEIFLKTKQK